MDHNVQNNHANGSANSNVNPTAGTLAYHYTNSNTVNPITVNPNMVNPNITNPAVNTTAHRTANPNPNVSSAGTNPGTTAAMPGTVPAAYSNTSDNVASTAAQAVYSNTNVINTNVNTNAMAQPTANTYMGANAASNAMVTPAATANYNTNAGTAATVQPGNATSNAAAQSNPIMTTTVEPNTVAGSGVIDSRTFTRLTDDWKYERESTEHNMEYERESTKYNAEVKKPLPPAAAPPVYDDTPRGPFRVFLRMLAGVIAFIVAAIPVSIFFKMEYISTLQMITTVIPSALMVFIFLKLNKQITRTECMWLIFINVVLSIILFWSCMACSMQKLYPILTFSEAWKSVGYMPQTGEGMRIFLLQFLLTAFGSILIGSGSAICYHKGYK